MLPSECAIQLLQNVSDFLEECQRLEVAWREVGLGNINNDVVDGTKRLTVDELKRVYGRMRDVRRVGDVIINMLIDIHKVAGVQEARLRFFYGEPKRASS